MKIFYHNVDTEKFMGPLQQVAYDYYNSRYHAVARKVKQLRNSLRKVWACYI